MHKYLIIWLAALMLLPSANASAANVETIAVVVNEDVITASDLKDRMNLIIKSSGLQMTNEIQDRLRPQVLDTLIEEQLKFQEAKRQEVEVSDEEVDAGFALLAKQNKTDPEKFKKAIEQSGISVDTMRRQIRSELVWNKVIQKALRSKVNVTESDVETYLERIKNAMGKKEFLLAEIYLPVDDAKKESNIRQLANRLISEMKTGKAPFSKVAQQFSKSAGASKGGDMGWIQEGQLPEDLDKVLVEMNKGELSNPIRTVGGYHILFVRDARQISEDSIPEIQQVRNRIGLDRLDKIQQRYLFDLRAEAFIDNRANF